MMLEFGPMGSPLRIPDDMRGGGPLTDLFEPPDHGWSFWILLVVVGTLNFWFDYYHPLGILFDIVIVSIWAVGGKVSSRKE